MRSEGGRELGEGKGGREQGGRERRNMREKKRGGGGGGEQGGKGEGRSREQNGNIEGF